VQRPSSSDDLKLRVRSLPLIANFTRALNLLAGAFVTNAGVVRKVVPLRSAPTPRNWRQPPTPTHLGKYT
jgi:hypothetical protein